MAAKITIAIIASAKEKAKTIACKIAGENYFLLIISNDEKFNTLREEIQFLYSGAKVEIIQCTRDACWEADVIILDIPHLMQEEMVEMIKEVSVQKIVVNMSEEIYGNSDQLQKLLKHSKVVNVIGSSGSSKKIITGNDSESVKFVCFLFNKTEHPV
jgi:predicted dinucleotide-binding enzyme